MSNFCQPCQHNQEDSTDNGGCTVCNESKKMDNSANIIADKPVEHCVYDVPKMDCPSEVAMIQMAFSSAKIPLLVLDCNTINRRIEIYHQFDTERITRVLDSLRLDARLIAHKTLDSGQLSSVSVSTDKDNRDTREAQILKWLLAINALMFVLEIVVGFYAQSTGLIADALDMFADAAVYGLALFAVGKSSALKLKAAHLSGYLQLILAMSVLFEVIRRLIYGSEPVSLLMMAMGFLALLANVSCMLLIYKKRDNGAHLRATWIFSANDVIANIGIILAGLMVMYSGSALPDLLIGSIVSILVLSGAIRILSLK